MKKKLLLSLLVVVMMCVFAISASATAIDTDTTVTLNGSFTTDAGSVTNPEVNLYDSEGYALVWYLDTNNKLVSDRAVNFITVTSGTAKFNDLSKVYGGSQQKGIVVVNLRDDFVNDGITGVEKFDSNFQFGYYGANRNVPIQYFYFPKTATEIIDRMFQNTQLIIADIEPGTPIAYMGVHAVAQSNLKEFFVPNDIPSFIEHDDVGIFQDTQLEKITFEEGSQIKVIPYRCFYMCSKLKELVLPNSVEEIHYRAIQLTLWDSNAKLEKLVLGASFKGFYGITGDNFYVRGASNLKVYLPATFNADNVDVSTAHQTFTFCPNATFYYCGTEAQWDALIAKISEGKNGSVGTDSDENIVTAKANGKVVFNYSACDAFYNGVHKEGDTVNGSACYLADCSRCNVGELYIGGDINSETHSFSYAYAYNNGFTAVGTLTSTCANAGCNYCAEKTPDVAELAPIFKNLMYSKREGTEFGIVMTYEIDNDALAVYKSGASTTVNFGVVAIAEHKYNSEKDLVKADGTTEQTNIILADISDKGAKTVELVIKGSGDQWEANKATPFYILGYYIDGNTVNYFQSTSKTAVTDLTTIKFESTPAEEVA